MIPIRGLEEYRIDRSAVVDGETLETAHAIVEDVRRKGDAAVRAYTKKFDGAELESFEADFSSVSLPTTVQNAIRSSYESVVRFHKNGVARSWEIQPVRGMTLGVSAVPYERAGIYVPGGRAVYPSSVIMAAAPATVAGVKELILCSPPDTAGKLPESVLAAAKLCGVARVFKVGGAQAIAAMAYGTASLPACEILVGPGNRFVTAAKKIVSEDVAIDFLAGPTEILILSDGETNPRFIAADLIAQAEHDPAACALFVTSSRAQAEAVAEELGRQVPSHERREIIERSLRDHGAILQAPDLDAAIAFANRFAPEHLVISFRNPAIVLRSIRHAGSVFLGEYSPVAAGDYGVGPNAILPTLGDARRRSGLCANTFVKTISYQMLTPDGLRAVTPTALALAKVENLGAHARSIEIRHER